MTHNLKDYDRQRHEVLKRLDLHPGLTSKELGQIYASEGYDRYVFARRLPELRDLGLAKVVGRGERNQQLWESH